MFVWNNCFETDELFSSIVNVNQKDSVIHILDNFSLLLDFAEREALSNQPIHEYILLSMLESNNVFVSACLNNADLGTIYNYALKDVSFILNSVFSEEFTSLIEDSDLKEFLFYEKVKTKKNLAYGFEDSINTMLTLNEPVALLNKIIEHIRTFGSGKGSGYIGYVWRDNKLNKIDIIDSITFDELYHIDYQKNALIENTRSFLEDRNANNVLLCGTMGSGKSSCVKALLNEFSKERLRVVELDKNSFSQIKTLMNQLGQNQAKYIIYMDDISFENDDTSYSYLKSALDGYLEKNYDNILFYATSNRRNIVKSTWSDRNTGEEVHENDVLNEKNSLVERFGIKLYFGTYSQAQYFDMIEYGLNTRGIEFTDETRKEALKWERFYHTRSGRTASNFIKNYSANYFEKTLS